MDKVAAEVNKLGFDVCMSNGKGEKNGKWNSEIPHQQSQIIYIVKAIKV